MTDRDDRPPGWPARYTPPTVAPDGDAALRAENARLRAALVEVMAWISNWSPNFEDDDEWPATAEKVRAALANSPPADAGAREGT